MTPALTTDLPIERTRELREAAPGVLSALPGDDAGAPYDRHARLYDRVIGSPTYNRIIWGSKTTDYAAFAHEALAAGSGPFLDAGCGTAVFTAAAYREAARPLVLVDRSIGMIEAAAVRLDGASVTLAQADLHDLPFAPAQFETVACFAMIHVLDDPWAALAALREHVAPGGSFFASMLVAGERGLSSRYLAALQRRGEVSTPRTAAELFDAARDVFGPSATVECAGAMAYLRARL